MAEKDIESYLRRQAKKHDCLVYKFTSPANRGVPDDIVIWPNGDIHFVELKTTTGRLTPGQREHLRRLTNHGQACYVLYGVEDVDLYFELQCDIWDDHELRSDASP